MNPVAIWHVSFMALFTALAWPDLLHTGQSYSAVEKHNAFAVILSTNGRALHLTETRFLRTLSLVITFCLVLTQCCLWVRMRSNVMTRYIGKSVCSRSFSSNSTFNFRLVFSSTFVIFCWTIIIKQWRVYSSINVLGAKYGNYNQFSPLFFISVHFLV